MNEEMDNTAQVEEFVEEQPVQEQFPTLNDFLPMQECQEMFGNGFI